MSIYTPPALNAVNFALEAFTPADITPYGVVLSPYTVPATNAVNFALTTYTPPTFQNVGWELLPSGGISYTLTCAVGAYAYTGQAATLTVARNLELETGSYVYTGGDAQLAVGRTLECETGVYVYTGLDAELTVVVKPAESPSGGGTRRYREEIERSLLIQQDQQDFLDLIYIVGRIVEKIKSM
jgi:hypothetical protein